ncbi:unnamed protein product, partial [Amoebophrya sp. A25]
PGSCTLKGTCSVVGGPGGPSKTNVTAPIGVDELQGVVRREARQPNLRRTSSKRERAVKFLSNLKSALQTALAAEESSEHYLQTSSEGLRRLIDSEDSDPDGDCLVFSRRQASSFVSRQLASGRIHVPGVHCHVDVLPYVDFEQYAHNLFD